MNIVKYIKGILKRLLFGLSKVAKKVVPEAYDVMGVIKNIAENKITVKSLDALVAFIPGRWDNILASLIVTDLPKILAELMLSEEAVMEVLTNAEPEEQFRLAMDELKKATKAKRGSTYLEAGAKLAEIASEYKLSRTDSITFMQGQHDLVSNEKVNTEI